MVKRAGDANRVPGKRTGKRIGKRALGVGVSLAVSAALLLAIELILVSFAPVEHRRPIRSHAASLRGLHVRSELAGLEYELAINAAVRMNVWDTTVRTNAFGMRGPALTLQKPPATVRVAFVGDSFTFGYGVADDETFVAQLGELFEEDAQPNAPAYEFLNFGVSGYSSLDEAIVVRNKVLDFEPDLIIVGYCLNDPELHPGHPLHMAMHEPFWWERWNIARLVHQRLEAAAIARTEGLFHYLHSTPEHWKNVEAAFADIATAAGDRGVPVGLVLMPLLVRDSWEEYPTAALHEQVAREGSKHGFSVLDMRLVLAKYLAVPRKLAQEDGHATPRGNRAFARAIRQFLQQSYPELFPHSPTEGQ